MAGGGEGCAGLVLAGADGLFAVPGPVAGFWTGFADWPLAVFFSAGAASFVAEGWLDGWSLVPSGAACTAAADFLGVAPEVAPGVCPVPFPMFPRLGAAV